MRPLNLFTVLAVAASGVQALAVAREVNLKLAVRAVDELHAQEPTRAKEQRHIESPQAPRIPEGGHLAERPDEAAAAAPATDHEPVLAARYLPETPTRPPGTFRKKCASTATRLGKMAHTCGNALDKLANRVGGNSGTYFSGQPSQYADPAHLQGQAYSHAMAGQQHPAPQQINVQQGYQQPAYQQQGYQQQGHQQQGYQHSLYPQLPPDQPVYPKPGYQ
ncbi:hypothetical protein MCOR02_006908 [Pyricularia oryzae]|uniref:Uncharacterized protein n=1 Tax=Pyricularia oryzae TaxID=318829 RepID=A0A4P7NRZ2_PYROR|nr:hypothetical protein MCOR01_003489 [Pyricularia oryzae]KAH9432203.1 hypothetical protein MCOR02_006908 [Pyricularia oryzae]KAI6254242.1 hypothetical protein MCOR19_009227 [Pyricularia oryzae]KAI6267870.1 hypothetical protein MCOR26_009494 [Pyricularia oryzae]KAI6307455.1 hypothetical protein MCOR34_007599 [Pyricularia oryzae]